MNKNLNSPRVLARKKREAAALKANMKKRKVGAINNDRHSSQAEPKAQRELEPR